MTMKRMLSSVVLIAALAICGFAQEVCKRHAEGGYSICVPQGWTVEERQNQKYKLFLAPPEGGFTPNMHFIDEVNALPLADYATGNGKYALENYAQIGATSMKLIARAPFRTTSGIQAIRLSFSTEFKGTMVRTLQYYFGGKDNRKLIVTCTFPEAQKETLDPLFERALKSFQFDK